MILPLAVNGRFLTQPLSGVQRYALEILTALDRLLPADCAPIPVLHPGPPLSEPPVWRILRPTPAGPLTGHLWEQVALARAARRRRLLSLCGAGPLLHRDQIIAIHDANIWDMPDSFSLLYRCFHATMRPRLAARARATVTVSHSAARALAPRLGVPPARLHVIPNAASHLVRIAPDAETLGRYGLAKQGYFLAIGNLSPNKNLARLAAAHARAQAADPVLPPLAIAGAAASGLATALLSPRPGLYLLGRVTDAELRALMVGAQAFLWPALSEGFGIPPLEAMACGLPVLSSNTSAMPEVLGDAPLWFDPRDAGDIARALATFAAMPAAGRAAMVARGHARAATYAWEDSARRLLALALRTDDPVGEPPPA
jgi:glycosyltransferase involved in cell wall biosynthesis